MCSVSSNKYTSFIQIKLIKNLEFIGIYRVLSLVSYTFVATKMCQAILILKAKIRK